MKSCNLLWIMRFIFVFVLSGCLSVEMYNLRANVNDEDVQINVCKHQV